MILTSIVAALLLQVQVRDEPKDWKLITTAHFDIYYPSDEILPRARQFAGWFEESYEDLAKKTGAKPKRVHVFLYRSFLDLLQSSFFGTPGSIPLTARQPTSPFALGSPAGSGILGHEQHKPIPCRPNASRPTSKSRALAISEPLRDRIFIHCQASDKWNKWFAHHELAHHFQFGNLYPFQVPSWMIALRDPLTPEWWFEGGADYLANIFDSDKDLRVRDLANERLYTLPELYSQDILN